MAADLINARRCMTHEVDDAEPSARLEDACQHCIEMQQQWTAHAHEASAYEDVAKYLRSRAGQLFMAGGKDELARYLRDDLAAGFERNAADKRAAAERARVLFQADRR